MYKAKQRMKTLLLACFAALVSMFLAVALWVTPTSKIDASAAEITYSYTFSAKQFSANGTTTLNEVDWTLAGDGGYWGYDGTKGQQFGSGKYPYKSLTLTSESFSNVSEIKINTSGASSINATLTVSVAGTQVGEETSLTTTATEYTFTLASPLTGEVKFSYTQTSSKAIYINSITVTYNSDGGSTDCEHNYESVVTEPTCTEKGYTTYTCSKCDYSYTEEIPATGHDTQENTTKPATCTEAGSKTITCTKCDLNKTEEIPVIDHNYVDGACSVCGAVEPKQASEMLNVFGNTGILAGDSSSISWTGTAINVVNKKGGTAIRTSDSDHYRAYAGSITTISTMSSEIITKIIITCTSADYATVCMNSITTEGATASVNGSEVIIEGAMEALTITATAQWRLSKVNVTYEPGCEHANTIETITKEPTCTDTGSKTLTCTACANVEEVEIPALGHNYDAGVVTPPTATDEGYTTYTCTRENCGHTYQDDFVPATGATMYTVSYSTPDGVADILSEEVAENFAHTLPIADAPDGYVFLGWVTTAYEASSNAPANIYAAESEYTVTENVTFYALYSWGEISWSLVTDAKKLAAGNEIVIVASGDSNFALGTDRGNNRNAAEITKNDNKVTVNDNVQIITLETGNVANTFAFNVGTDGYLYAASSSSNQLKTKTTLDNNGSWLIEIADDIATIKAQGTNTRNWLRFNSSNNPPIFSCYGSGQKDVSLYMKGGAVFYTTSLIEKDFDSASVTIGTDVKLNYYADVSDVFENVEMQYYVADNDSEVFTAVGEKVDGRWKFTLNVAPQAMTDVFNASIVSNGIVLDTIEEYSVQKYVINQLANSPSDELKQLLTDMLHYGAAAQNYKGYNTESLATTGVDNIGTASDVLPGEECKSNLTTTKDLESYPAYFTGATVWFDGINKLRVYITTIDGASLSNVTLTINGEAVAVSGNMIETDGILATQFGETYTFVLSYDGTVMQTLTYSVNAYAYAKKDDAEMGELALALYRYGVSAKVYAGA